MARPMNPLPARRTPLTEFAADLRRLHQKAGSPTLRSIAQRYSVSPASLSHALNAKNRPTWRTVSALVITCGGDLAEWSNRWETLCSDRDKHIDHASLFDRWARTGGVTPPNVTSMAEFRDVLCAVRTFSGRSLRTIAQNSPGYSHTTYSAMLRGTRPITASILVAYLLGCDVPVDIPTWLRTLSALDPRQALDSARALTRLNEQIAQMVPTNTQMSRLKEALANLRRRRQPFTVSGGLPSPADRDNLRTAITQVMELLGDFPGPNAYEVGKRLRIPTAIATAYVAGLTLPDIAFVERYIPMRLRHRHTQTVVTMALTYSLQLLRDDRRQRPQPFVREQPTHHPSTAVA